MRRSLSIIIILSVVALLSGCMFSISATPDTGKTIIMYPGEKQVFTVTTVGGPVVLNQWFSYPFYPAFSWNLGNFSMHTLAPTKEDAGKYSLECKVDVGIVVYKWPSVEIVGWHGTITWTIEVCGIQAKPNQEKWTIMPGYSHLFSVTAYPLSGQFNYTWYLDDTIVPDATVPDYTFAPQLADAGDHVLKVAVSGWESSNADIRNSMTWNIHVPSSTALPTIEWQKMYGTTKHDVAHSIQQTADGGYIAAGSSTSAEDWDDFYIIRIDALGNVLWQKKYGGSSTDELNCIRQTRDGGYIAAGSSWSSIIQPGVNNNGGSDYYVVKLDPAGEIIWQKMFGGNGNDLAQSILQTADGGYVLAGYSDSQISGVTHYGADDIFIIKLDADGTIEWQKMYGDKNDDQAFDIRQTTDGGYIVVGSTNSSGASGEVWKLDLQGNVQWNKRYGRNRDIIHSVQQTNDGGYIMAGGGYYGGCLVLKLAPSGVQEWLEFLGGGIMGYSVQQTADGGYLVGGISSSWDIPFVPGVWVEGLYLSKHDSQGKVNWQQTYRAQTSSNAAAQQTADGGYIIVGTADNGQMDDDFIVIKLRPE